MLVNSRRISVRHPCLSLPLRAGVLWDCVLSESQGVWLLRLLAGENLYSFLLHEFS